MTDSHFVDIEWDEAKNNLNRNKHRISFEEAATIFNDRLELTIPDPDHSIAERRFLSIGYSTNDQMLVVSYTERTGKVRIISARKPTKRERRIYEEGTMRPEYDFSEGVRGKHVGKHLRIIGDASSPAKGVKGSAKSRNDNTLVGTAGEYYVCAELCRRGYLALLTPKNNPLFDVVATNIDGTASVSIQVKTRSVGNNQGWKINKLPNESDTPGDPFMVLVNLQATGSPDFYIYRYSEFASRVNEEFDSYISKPKRNGEPRKDPGFRAFDEKHFRDSDRARKNDWNPIILALTENSSYSDKP